MKKNIFYNTREYANRLDKNDELANLKKQFHFPNIHHKRSSLYFCGNSLGLQSIQVKEDVLQVIEDWRNYAVEGHFNAKTPWFKYHEFLNKTTSDIVGAKSNEIVIMNSLTVNLHLLMVSFYKPKLRKKKILIEANTFPSDLYAVQSQLKFHNNDPKNDLIILDSDNDKIISTEQIINTIKSKRDEIALILLGGVNYLTGQLFDIEIISNVAKECDCIIGLDLAHAAGNVELKLNEWDIDFASWCGYKYLNGGPGAPSGVFINSKYFNSKGIKRFEGWWGHDKANRFALSKKFQPINSAEAWQISNPPILSMAGLLSSLKIFDKVGMGKLIKKSHLMTSYLEYLLKENFDNDIKILTPDNKYERGCQLSIQFKSLNKDIIQKLYQNSTICDFREPNILRIAPVPLYNSYLDCYKLVNILKDILI